MPTSFALPKWFRALNVIQFRMKYKVENTSKFKKGKAFSIDDHVSK